MMAEAVLKVRHSCTITSVRGGAIQLLLLHQGPLPASVYSCGRLARLLRFSLAGKKLP
jgi:hypothetical protein